MLGHGKSHLDLVDWGESAVPSLGQGKMGYFHFPACVVE